MVERKPLSKKIRFEVFKRDSFKCQYCGCSAPDKILEVDHINPVSSGGKNTLMNLITSCFDCNRGKGKKLLNDLTVVEKQRIQIEELNLRRQQLEMMLSWRDGEIKIKNLELTKSIDYFNSKFDDCQLNELGNKKINILLKKYGIIDLLNAIDLAYSKYYKNEDDFELILQKTGAILNVSKMPEHKQKISYIMGICRNKEYAFGYKDLSFLLNRFYEKGGCLDDLTYKLKSNCFINYRSMVSSISQYLKSNQ